MRTIASLYCPLFPVETSNQRSDQAKQPKRSYNMLTITNRKSTCDFTSKKKTGYGHSYLYEFKTRELNGKAASSDKPPVDPISASDLRDLIVHWSKNGWSPKSNTAASQVLLLFSQLHQFYWLQLDRGISVDQTDLDHLKAKLKAARDTAADFLAFFDKLLVTEELWDNKRSATFVLEGLEDPLSYIEIARTVSEVLK
jgi:hypothetical protein